MSSKNSSTPAPVFLSPRHIGERWDCSRMQVNRLILSGRLPACNFGNGKRRAIWRVALADLEQYERITRTAQ